MRSRFSGTIVRRRALVGARPTSSSRPWKYERYCFATATASASSSTRDVDDAVRAPARRSARSLGREHAEAAALDHRRAAHADVRVLGRDDDVAAAEERRVAGEAAAGVDADERHEAAERAIARTSACRGARQEVPEDGRGPAAGAVAAGAGAAAAALGEEDDRQAPLLGELEHAVGLAVVDGALRAGEHGVVVRADHGARAVGRRTTSPLTLPMPLIMPSVGNLRDDLVDRQRRSPRRRSRALPYSTNVPGSQRSSMFSRAVRWLVLRRRATASGRAASSVTAWRSMHLRRGRGGRRRGRPRRSSAATRSPTSPGSTNTSGWPSKTVSPTATRDAAHEAGLRWRR